MLIPAWKPACALSGLVDSLLSCGSGAIIVVDDGSGEAYAPVFAGLAGRARVYILRHTANRGKGQALKTGFTHFLNELKDFEYLITADADGQHTPGDIVRVAEAAISGRSPTVLGSRTLPGDAPWRSRFGNTLTRHIFAWTTGTRLVDTQTGLRGFPRALLPELLSVPGERYEYEMAVLAHVCRHYGRPVEVPVEAVYLEGNQSSHFHPVLDSVRVYLALVRFLLSSRIASK